MDFNGIVDFIFEHIDVIISAIVGLFSGMQIEKIIIKNKNNVINSPGTKVHNGGVNGYKDKK